MLCDHEIIRMTDQTTKGIKYAVNSLIQGKVSAKRRATDELKALHTLKLGDQEAESWSEDQFLHKFCMMLTKDDQGDLRQYESVNIGIVKEYKVQLGKTCGGGWGSVQFNNNMKEMLHLTST